MSSIKGNSTRTTLRMTLEKRPIGFTQKDYNALSPLGKLKTAGLLYHFLVSCKENFEINFVGLSALQTVPLMKDPETGKVRFLWLHEVLKGIRDETLEPETLKKSFFSCSSAQRLRTLTNSDLSQYSDETVCIHFVRTLRRRMMHQDAASLENELPELSRQIRESDPETTLDALSFVIARFWTDGKDTVLYYEDRSPAFNRLIWGLIFPFDDDGYLVLYFRFEENNGKSELKILADEDFANIPAFN